MSRPSILTASASGLSREPWQAGAVLEPPEAAHEQTGSEAGACGPRARERSPSGPTKPRSGTPSMSSSTWPALSSRTGRRPGCRARGRPRAIHRGSCDKPESTRAQSHPSGSIGDGSGTIRLRSSSIVRPVPSQTGQAPERAVVAEEIRLRLDVVGPASAASPAANVTCATLPSAITRHRPSPSSKAVSIESARRSGRRCREPGDRR